MLNHTQDMKTKQNAKSNTQPTPAGDEALVSEPSSSAISSKPDGSADHVGSSQPDVAQLTKLGPSTGASLRPQSVSDPTNPADITITPPINTNNIINERLSNVVISTRTDKNVSGVSRISAIEWLHDIETLTPFDTTATPEAILGYRFDYSQEVIGDDVYDYNNPFPIFDLARKAFRYGLNFAQIDYTPECLTNLKIQSANGTLYTPSKILQVTGGLNKINHAHMTTLENTSAELIMLVHCAMKKEIQRLTGNTVITNPNTFAPFLSQKIDVATATRSVMLPFVYNTIEDLPTMQAYIADISHVESPTRFRYGEMATFVDGRHGWTAAATHALGLSQYEAQILNNNFQYAVDMRVATERLRLSIAALAPPESTVDISQDVDFFPMNLPSSTISLHSYMMTMCREKTYSDAILHQFMSYLHEADMLEFSNRAGVVSSEIASSQANAAYESHVRRLANGYSFETILRTFAEEIHFLTRIGRFIPIPVSTLSASMIHVLHAYMLLQLFYPVKFWIYARQIQNELMIIFKNVYPNEYNAIITAFGTWYTIDQAGQPQRTPNNHTPFTASEIFSDRYPTLFRYAQPGGMVFPGAQNISNIMSLMIPLYPQGIPDQGAIDAEFPRLQANPSHYIGYPEYNNFGIMETRLLQINQLLNAQTGSFVTIDRKSDIQTIQKQTAYIHLKAMICASGLCRSIRPLLTTMANFPLAVASNFLPNPDGHRNHQYGIASQGGQHGPPDLLRFYDEQDSFHATNVIGLIMHTQNRIMSMIDENSRRALGETQSDIPRVEYELKVPRPIDIFNSSNALLSDLRNISFPDGVILEIFRTNPDPDPSLVELRNRWGLNNFADTYHQIRHLFSTLLKIDAKMYLKGDTAHTRDFTRDGRLSNPQIRRMNNMQQAIPFAPGIDHPDMEGVVSLVTTSQRENLIVGAKMITQMRRIYRGIRLKKTFINVPSVNPINVPADYIARDYAPNMFVNAQVEGVNVRMYVNEEQQQLQDPAHWGRVHLTIPGVSGMTFSRDIEMILRGVENADWIVDIPNARYTVQLTSSTRDLEGMNNITLSDVMKVSEDQWLKILFYYNPLRPNDNKFKLPPMYSVYQHIHPMENILDSVMLGGFATAQGEGDVPYVQVPDQREYFTGTINQNNQNVYALNGPPKVNIARVSMSNVVRGVKDIVSFNKDIEVIVRAPYEYQT